MNNSNWMGWGKGDYVENTKNKKRGKILQAYGNDALVEYDDGSRERVPLSDLLVLQYNIE